MSDIPDDLKHILGPNEQVAVYIKQKIYHPQINIDSVAITNERIILRHPLDLRLKKDYTDFNYQDIANVVLDKGFVRSTIKCTLRLGGEPLSLNDLPNSEAEKAYGVIRENLVRFQAPFSAGYAGVPGYQRQGAPAAVCPKCGASLILGQKFCGSCGAPI
ncbi:MAG: PH domain-containing protein [Nitrososphaerales archaeon]